MNKKRAIILSVFIILILINAIVISLYLNLRSQPSPCNTNQEFELLSSEIAWKDVNTFLEEQKELRISYAPMKPKILEIVNNTQGGYGVYFEDLTTGAWLGINEKDEFMPVSLIKMPLLAAVLKKVENGDITLEQNITIKKEFLDYKSGSLYKKGEGYVITIKELLIYLIKESDNTAFFALTSVVTEEEFNTARLAMGLSELKDPAQISPKDYANMLRSLYLSTYLRRDFSELALSLMIDTNFSLGLPSGVPKGIKVAHKVGFYLKGGYHHDCGIIYDFYNDKLYPYSLCIMSNNSTQEESDDIISKVSRVVYDYRHANELS